MITRAVEIECLPDEIPEHFVVDVTELMIGQSKRASDLPLSGSMKLVSPPETVIAHMVAMRAEEVSRPPRPRPWPLKPRRPPAEPEVIKKGKKEEKPAEEGQGQEEVAPHVPGGRPGEPGRGVREYPAQYGFHGGGPAGGTARHPRQPAEIPGRWSGWAQIAGQRGDAGQAANIYESQRHVARAADGEAFDRRQGT